MPFGIFRKHKKTKPFGPAGAGDYNTAELKDMLADLDEYIRKNLMPESAPDMVGSAMNAMMSAPQAWQKAEPAGEKAISPMSFAPRLGKKTTGAMDMPAQREAAKMPYCEPDGEADYETVADIPAIEAEPLRSAARSLDDAIKDIEKSFMEMVFSHADEKGISDVEVQKRANLDRKAFSKLKCGTTKNPSKSTALALAVALELNLDETKDLLSRAGYALSPCSRQDIIVKYFIEREVYDIYAVNYALFEHGEPLLGVQG